MMEKGHNVTTTPLLLVLQIFLCDEWFLNTSELTNDH